MIPTRRLEDVEMSHLNELRQTELYGMFVVRKHLVFHSKVCHETINKGDLLVKLLPMLHRGDRPRLSKFDLKEKDLPPIPKAGKKIPVEVEITTTLPKEEHVRELLERAGKCYDREIDSNIDLGATMEDVKMHVLIWAWRQKNIFETIAKSPDVTEFEEMNAAFDAVLGIAAGYLITGERLRRADPLSTDTLRDPDEAKLELANQIRGGGAYAHYQHNGICPGWRRGGKANAIRRRQREHATAASLLSLGNLRSSLYVLFPKRGAICSSEFASGVSEDLIAYAMYPMTKEGEERARELHYFPRGMVAFLMESRRDLAFQEKTVMTSQYHSESFAQHCLGPFGSLNRSGGYEAFGRYRRAFPVGLSAEATREARLEKQRERYQEMKANDPEKYAAYLETERKRARKRYQEMKANDPVKHAAYLETERERDRKRRKEMKANDPEKYAAKLEKDREGKRLESKELANKLEKSLALKSCRG